MAIQVIKWKNGHSLKYESETGRHSIMAKYLIIMDTLELNPFAVKTAAQLVTPEANALPKDRQRYGSTNMYVQSIELKMHDQHRQCWWADVTYATPSSGGNIAHFDLHPLYRTRTIKIDFIEEQVPVENAWNLEEFTGPSGFRRPLGTWGPVTNSALQETVDPLMTSKWNGVIVLQCAFPSPESVLALNNKFKNSTNSDQLFGVFQPRQLEYQVAQMGDYEEQDNIGYYNTQISIEMKETTDRYLNNVGWKEIVKLKEAVQWDIGNWWDPNDNTMPEPAEYGLKNITDDEGQEVSEPRFLTLSGKRSKGPVYIGYRYLKSIPYFTLVSNPRNALQGP